ncbi:Outer membrane cobalamin receptor protein [Candidatus Ornithobacterium hominis]|uniref:TonB-dependent receptor n=1 Tax=Candidatus Ornithobacterium hominis TaxID=2497989 RepID=UPI000E5C0231|nr:TonB-dependent receptor [Candidatus Ornithobacterium hominis]SZD72804.1 Outer membrane cobalamin receptor protein [Candidatus Ornithobacterium hominis]
MYKKVFLLGTLGAIISANAQENKAANDSINQEIIQLDEISVSPTRATDKTPMTFSSVSKETLAKQNLGQDIPILLNLLPSVVTTSDAGNGVGYTGIRVRGTDATRVNVTINGIPYNDSESQGTFWVNMPDFVSSVENIQLQRGVGTSTNGSGAFGASLNLLTNNISPNPSGELSASYGSFNTQKYTAKFSTGVMKNNFSFSGRFSKINSDGYIDRASSDLHSYFLQGAYTNKGTLIKALTFGGKEKTYQSWDGVQKEIMGNKVLFDQMEQYGRTYNPGGLMYKDSNGVQHFYDNHTDNYKQDHYQLHWNQQWDRKWNTNLAFHYTKGFGYYESYRRGKKLKDYSLEALEINGQKASKSDLIDRKYLDNDFYGATFALNYKNNGLDFTFGSAGNYYKGWHFGEILWVKEAVKQSYKQEFYRDLSEKYDFNNFLKANYQIGDVILYADLQYRNISYKANGEETGKVNDKFNFFNPKGGITYLANANHQFYASYARAQREPSRKDYKNGNPKPEKLNDFEAGWRFKQNNVAVNVNGYYMLYQDQLVLTGEIDNVGGAIRKNSGNSYRLGLELDAAVQFNQFSIRPAITISQNKNIDFVENQLGKLVKLGKTDISYSPNLIIGNTLTYSPIENLEFALQSKYVGKQFMSNTEAKNSQLDAYFTNDIRMNYELKLSDFAKAIRFNLLINNLFDLKYISNGYYYNYVDDWSTQGQKQLVEGVGYYPQAGINVLGGISLLF